MSAKGKHIVPETPLPMAVEDSPHWPLGRSRAARDAEAEWLAARLKARDQSGLAREVAPFAYEPSDKRYAYLLAALHGKRDCRAIGSLQRLRIFARWCVTLEQRESPPPAKFPTPLSSLTTP